MSARGTQLLDIADGQISDLIGLFSARGEAFLRLRCPGREKLGDGTVAALALHTADNYLRIAGVLQAASRMCAALLEQVLASLLNHQGHPIDAMKAAVR